MNTTETLPTAPRVLEIDAVVREDEVTNRFVVVVEGREYSQQLDRFGLTFDSSEQEIISAVRQEILEATRQDISRHYKVQKETNTRTVYIIPNSTAG